MGGTAAILPQGEAFSRDLLDQTSVLSVPRGRGGGGGLWLQMTVHNRCL